MGFAREFGLRHFSLILLLNHRCSNGVARQRTGGLCYMKLQFLTMIVAILLPATLTLAQDEVVDLSHNGGGWNSFGEEVDEIKRFQTFFAAATSIGRIQVKIRYLSGVAPNGDVIAEVYETDGDLPVGEALAEGKLAKGDAIPEDVNEILLECGGLEVGEEYAIALDQDPRQNNVCYEWNNGIDLDSELQFGKFTGVWFDESFLGDGWLMVFPGELSVSYTGKLTTTWAGIKKQ
jgi:hypothetical protein